MCLATALASLHSNNHKYLERDGDGLTCEYTQHKILQCSLLVLMALGIVLSFVGSHYSTIGERIINANFIKVGSALMIAGIAASLIGLIGYISQEIYLDCKGR
jgi:glutaminase